MMRPAPRGRLRDLVLAIRARPRNLDLAIDALLIAMAAACAAYMLAALLAGRL